VPADSIIFVVAVIVAFSAFAVTLAWGHARAHGTEQ